MPSEDIVWLRCDACGYGQMFLTNGICEKPGHVCGTSTFIPIVGVEDDDEGEEDEYV